MPDRPLRSISDWPMRWNMPGTTSGASATYDEAYSFCSANGLEPTAQLCLACLTAVLRQSGDWDRAAKLCQQVIESSDATVHARAVATGMLGSILGVRGQTRQARPLLLEAATLARQIELAAMELLSSWGLAIVDSVEGATQSAVGHCWALLERWKQTEERHYVIRPFAGPRRSSPSPGTPPVPGPAPPRSPRSRLMLVRTRRCPRSRTRLGETALIDGSLDQAADQFARALVLLQGHDAPFERAESQRRLASVLVAAGRRDEAVEHLVAAYRTARRLGAKPLANQLAGALSALGERAERRLSKRSAAQLDHGGLTRREVEIVRMVATGRTNREIARELFLSPRTVDMHVSSILTKLDGRSRADAARRASELGLLTQTSLRRY